MSDLTEWNEKGQPGVSKKFKDEVIEQLKLNFAHDNIEVEEFERRIHLAENAASRQELTVLVKDLPRIRTERQAGTPAVEREYETNPGSVRDSQQMVAIFSGTNKRGIWDPARNIRVFSCFGGSKLDFRKARLSPGVTRIHAVSVFGGTDIIVPPGINVEVNGMGIFGGFHDTRLRSDDPDSPTIIIDGIALFGGVDVKVKKPR